MKRWKLKKNQIINLTLLRVKKKIIIKNIRKQQSTLYLHWTRVSGHPLSNNILLPDKSARATNATGVWLFVHECTGGSSVMKIDRSDVRGTWRFRNLVDGTVRKCDSLRRAAPRFRRKSVSLFQWREGVGRRRKPKQNRISRGQMTLSDLKGTATRDRVRHERQRGGGEGRVGGGVSKGSPFDWNFAWSSVRGLPCREGRMSGGRRWYGDRRIIVTSTTVSHGHAHCIRGPIGWKREARAWSPLLLRLAACCCSAPPSSS